MIARLIEVIETDLELRGKGTTEDPYRRVTQYWSKEGLLLAEKDPQEVITRRQSKTLGD